MDESTDDPVDREAMKFTDFWSSHGHIVSPLLDFSCLVSLAASSKAAFHFCDLRQGEMWRFTAEISSELWSRARRRAKAVIGDGCSSRTPLADVVLPKGNLLRGLPQHIAKDASRCRSLILDFTPVAHFQEAVSQTAILTRDPWQHVAVRMLLDPLELDNTLRAAGRGFKFLKELRLRSLPAMALWKQIWQEDAEEPSAFPVLRSLSRFQDLRVLSFESRGSHPHFVSTLSGRAFKTLTQELQKLRLQDLTLATFILKEDNKPSASPMSFAPFLHLPTLRRLKLSAVAPAILDMRNAPGLEELDLGFAGAGDLVAEDLGSLRTLILSGLKRDVLRPWLAKSLLDSPSLEHLGLSGARQDAFLEEFCSQLELGKPRERLSMEICSPSGPPGATEIERLARALRRNGGEVQVSGEGSSVDPLLSPEDVANRESRPCKGLKTFGEGMEWFLGGQLPAPLTAHQIGIINNRCDLHAQSGLAGSCQGTYVR